MIKKLFLIATACLFIFQNCDAQDTLHDKLPAQWSLDNCIEYAKANNISVNTLRLDMRSSEQDLLQAKASRLPSASGSVSQSLVNSKNTDPVVGGLQTQANFSSSYSINSSLTVYNAGYVNNDIQSKRLSLESANLSVKEAENNITLTVTQAYLNILLARENIVYLEDLLATSQAQLKQGQQRFDAGSLSRKELVQLQAQTANDRYNLISAQNDYRLNTVTLKQVLQLPSSYNFQIALSDTVTIENAFPALPEVQNVAQQLRPEIQNSHLALQIANIELDKIKAATKPTVSLGATLSTGYSDNQTSKYLSQLGNNFYQTLGLSVSIPIYSRRINKTNIAKSKIQIDQAKLSLLNTQTELNQQVEQAYINLLNARAKYEAATAQAIASEESYKITNEQLNLGAVNLVEMQQQKNLFIQAKQALLQAKYTAALNYKIYQFYAGKPITQ